MYNSTILIKNGDPDPVVKFLAQRTKMLTRLIGNKNTSSINLENNPNIRHLKKEYNHITEQIAQLEHPPLPDLMTTLPLELCADIIEETVASDYPVDRLLELITVSRRWWNTLMSLPSLWAVIVFDRTKADYLAKAAVGLSLSGNSDLRVTISVTLEIWREISPVLVAESGRIVYLRIKNPLIGTDDSEALLSDFKGLPSLKTLHIPSISSCCTLNYCRQGIKLERMPLLSKIIGFYPEPLEYSFSRFMNRRIFSLPVITQDMVNAWAKFSNLIDLHLDEYAALPSDSPETFKSSLHSVQKFSYRGKALKRALNMLGPNVTSITVELHAFRQILDILTRFPQLYTLALIQTKSFNHGEVNTGTLPTAHSAVKALTIQGNKDDRTSTPELEEVITPWKRLYQALIAILTCIETLVLEDGPFVDETWSYVSSLKQLHKLTVSNCVFHLSNSHSAITMAHLSHVSWSMLPDSVVIFSKIKAPNLHSLHVDASRVGADATGFKISEDAYPSLTSLTLVFTRSLLWDIGIYKNLRELKLQTWLDLKIRSDILETILMRPRDFPALETIGLAGLPFECDILLLMLERKNIYAQPGISPIKKLIWRRIPLPYHLLYSITMLLRGMFPDQETYTGFSLDAVGQRMFNKSSTGCEMCCYSFRPCSTPTQAGPKTQPTRLWYEECGPRYVAKDIVADPPLTSDLKEWLAGKNERRFSFFHSDREIQGRFHRNYSCPAVRHSPSYFTITGSSLDEFGSDAREERPGLVRGCRARD